MQWENASIFDKTLNVIGVHLERCQNLYSSEGCWPVEGGLASWIIGYLVLRYYCFSSAFFLISCMFLGKFLHFY